MESILPPLSDIEYQKKDEKLWMNKDKIEGVQGHESKKIEVENFQQGL